MEVPEQALEAVPPLAELGRGEIGVLALAHSQGDALVLLDDEVARTVARRLSLSLCGTLGIVVLAGTSGSQTDCASKCYLRCGRLILS